MTQYYTIKKSNIIIAIVVGFILMITWGILFLKDPLAPSNVFGMGIGFGITILALEIILNSKAK
jgi:hypothetical protein